MKPIKLTLLHRGLIMEMIKALFPEYENISINVQKENKLVNLSKSTELKGDYLWLPHIHKDETQSYIETKYIHWFEFCITQISKRINQRKTFLYGIEQALRDDIHPVEFLYKQFKSLN